MEVPSIWQVCFLYGAGKRITKQRAKLTTSSYAQAALQAQKVRDLLIGASCCLGQPFGAARRHDIVFSGRCRIDQDQDKNHHE